MAYLIYTPGKVLTHIWKEKRDKFRRKRLKQDVIWPYMRHREVELLDEILQKQKPENCLEWGAGYSTLHFPQWLNRRSRWVSIEHDPVWVGKVKRYNHDPRVHIYHIPPNRYPFTDEYGEGTDTDCKEYIDFAGLFAPYDWILVDGQARIDCLQRAYDLIKPEGIVVLHDANRKFYYPPLTRFTHQLLLKDYRRTAGGLWFGSHTTPIAEFFDIPKHQRIWRIHIWIGKITRS